MYLMPTTDHNPKNSHKKQLQSSKPPWFPPVKPWFLPFNVENLVDNMWITCPLFFFADIGNILPPFSVL